MTDLHDTAMAVDTADNPTSAEPQSTPEELARAALKKDPSDFNSWVSLVGLLEQDDNLVALRKVFDDFLALFPFCFGYWKRYADAEQRHGNVAKIVEVFERAVDAVPYSVDIWVHYCAHISSQPDNAETARSMFERAVGVVGLDYTSSVVWDKYMEFEFAQQEYGRLTQLYHRVIAVPTLQLTRYVERYRQHAATRPLSELYLSPEEEAEIKTEVEGHQGPDGAPVEDIDQLEALKRTAIMTRREQVIQQTTEADGKRKQFELGIRRPYFHIVPLDDAQLANWRSYLKFEIAEGVTERITVLFERCLIACALYPEFWQLYAKWLVASAEDHDRARSLLKRSCDTFNVKNPEAYLYLARAYEREGNTAEARLVYANIVQSIAPKSVEFGLAAVSFERRHNDEDKVLDIYNHILTNVEENEAKAYVYVNKARYHAVRGETAAARTAYEECHGSIPTSKNAWLAHINFETNQGGDDVAARVDPLFAAALAVDDLPRPAKAEIAFARVEWEHDFGTDLATYERVQEEYLTEYGSTRTSASGKRGAGVLGLSDGTAKRAAYA